MTVLQAAAELHARAVEQFMAGRPSSALVSLRRALSLVGRSGETDVESATLTTRIWISIALMDSEVRGADAGLAALEQAAELAQRLDCPALDVLVHSQRGVIEMRRRHLTEALREFDLAHALIDYAQPHDQCVILLNRGTAHLYRGSLSAAWANLSGAARIARRLGDPVREFKARHNVAYAEFLAGNLPRALSLMDEALGINAPISRGIALLDRARVLVESGLTSAATHALLQAADVFRVERRGQDLGETYLELARCALLANDVEACRSYASKARDRFRARQSDDWRRSAELVLLQGDLAAGRPSLRVAAPAARLRAELSAVGLRIPSMTAALIAAEAQLSAGQTGAAAGTLASAGPPRARDPITLRLHYAHVRASVELAQGRRAAAVRRARAGLDELARYQASFGSIDLSSAAAVHGRRLTDLDLGVALDGNRVADVFAAAEHARAVAHRLPAVRPPADPRAAELLAELRQTVESLRAFDGEPVATRPLVRRRAELEREIGQLSWSRAGSGQTVRAASLEEVRAGVRRSDTVMLMLVQSATQLHALVIDGARLELHALGASGPVVESVRRVRADLDVLAQPRLPAPLRKAVHRSFVRSVAALDEALVRPLAVDGRALVIVSTGVLGQLPWGLLPSLVAAPVVVTSSATAWLAAHSRSRGRRHSVVALAGPDVERGEHEVKGVAQAWDAQTFVGEAADRGALIAAMSRAGVVHVAAHGVHQTENPLFSSLRLAGGDLFAHELDTTKRTADHVILSACELGLATVRPGDEALGLTSVLLHLGTRSVIAGVGRVGDEVAAETMTSYHRALAGGADSASALASALSCNEPDHPAPFACFGAAWRP